MDRLGITELFEAEYGTSPAIVVAAPGRVNLIGEHTDYNAGLVMPASIDKCMYFAARSNDSDYVHVHAADLSDKIEFSIHNDTKLQEGWANYCKGIVSTLQKLDYTIGGFDVVFSSDIPIGAGLSSSAALDCGLLKAIDSLFTLELTDWDIVNIANKSDNEYLGIASGILDQFACTFGKEDLCMLMDCGTHKFEYISAALPAHELVLINTNVKHEHLTSGYNNGPMECKETLRLLQAEYTDLHSLSDCTEELLMEVRAYLPRQLWERASYIVEENKRVSAFRNALLCGDVKSLGELLYASHEGLALKYKVSCRELDLLVAYTREESAIVGSRMMGGGFGGCTISIIETGQKAVLEHICSKYQGATGVRPELYTVKIGQGLRVL